MCCCYFWLFLLSLLRIITSMKTRLQNTKGSYGDYVGSLEATGRGASEGLTGHLSTHISETSMSVFSGLHYGLARVI